MRRRSFHRRPTAAGFSYADLMVTVRPEVHARIHQTLTSSPVRKPRARPEESLSHPRSPPVRLLSGPAGDSGTASGAEA